MSSTLSARDGACSEESTATEFVTTSEGSPSPDDAPDVRSPGSNTVPLNERLAFSVEEAGALLGISRDLAYDLVARRELPSIRLGRRLVVPRRALEDALSRLTEAR
jgi:excisionase family DNA binding protein